MRRRLLSALRRLAWSAAYSALVLYAVRHAEAWHSIPAIAALVAAFWVAESYGYRRGYAEALKRNPFYQIKLAFDRFARSTATIVAKLNAERELRDHAAAGAAFDAEELERAEASGLPVIAFGTGDHDHVAAEHVRDCSEYVDRAGHCRSRETDAICPLDLECRDEEARR